MEDNNLTLQQALYPRITSAGAYYAVSGSEATPSRNLLCSLLKQVNPQPLSLPMLKQLARVEDDSSAMNLLYRLQRLEFVYGTKTPEVLAKGNMEQRLPILMEQLSDTGRALLANDAGLYISAAGFHHESAEEIGALAGEMIRLSEQHSLLISNNLNIHQNAWSICDPSGQSHLAFYPLYFGEYKFVLVIGGKPQLQNEAFVEFVEILYRRYGA